MQSQVIIYPFFINDQFDIYGQIGYIQGMKLIKDHSINLIIANPQFDITNNLFLPVWLEESCRILTRTGSIFLKTKQSQLLTVLTR